MFGLAQSSTGNMNHWVIFILSIIFSTIVFGVKAQESFTIIPERDVYENLNDKLLTFDDSTHQLTINDIQQADIQKLFKKGKTSGLNHQHVYWGKLNLLNQDSTQTKWILQCDGYNSVVEVYIKQPNGTFLLRKTGEFVPASQKEINEATYPMVSLQLPYNQPIEVYIKIYTQLKDSPTFKLSLWHPDKINNYREWKRFSQGIFQGAFWILILYNLILYMIIRNKSYLFYSLYMIFITIYSLYVQGFTREYFFAEIPIYNAMIWICCANITAVMYYAFMRSFLNTSQLIPNTDQLIRFYMIFRLLLLPLELFTYYGLSNSPLTDLLTLSLTAIDAVFATYVLVMLFRTRDISARYFIIGAIFLYTAILLMIVLHGYSKLFYAIIYQLGTSLEVLLFSLGLGYQIRATEREKQLAQDNLIQELKNKEDLQRKHAEELENKVLDRTNELSESNQELQQMNEEMTVTLETLKDKNIIIENKNQAINDSILYAQRIQEAILSYEESLKASFKNHFVFFRPRDVVSGDFYWFRQKGDESILAVVDCTGHGVPGAFMSLIANDLLSHIIDEKQITSPEIILQNLHNGIRKALKQKENKNHDGMDIAVVNIKQNEKKLSFAGAKNPLIYIQNHELSMIRGDRFSIGGEQLENERLFTKYEIDLSVPTTLYLFSDGYQDQFGGEKDKKISARKLRELLSSIYTKSPKEQKEELGLYLDNWKKNEEQVDDILIVGVEIK